MTDSKLKEQFTAIFEANIAIILKISKAYTNTAQDREDLMNDIALELWKAFPLFKRKSKISTWIYRVALNTSMNYRRGKKSKFISFSDLRNVEVPFWFTEIDDSPETELLYNCIENLGEINKAIIILYLDGNSHEEIAEITGISKTNVGTRIGRIKEELKKIANSKI